MNIFTTVLLTILAFCLAAPGEIVQKKTPGERVQKKTCHPGAKWKEECHSCYCTEESKIVCSKEACPPQLVPRNKRYINREDCKEGEVWKEDCHTCYCSYGKPACTRELCESESNLRVVRPIPEDEHKTTKREAACIEGQHWKEDCHTCHCAAGKKACTRELCESESNLRVVRPTPEGEHKTTKREAACVEGQHWKEDCHTCHCAAGKKACTRELCESESNLRVVRPTTPQYEHKTIKREVECVEGQQWKEDCHTCHCAAGKKACTRELCESESNLRVEKHKNRADDSSEELRELGKCPPNKKEWVEDCNQCYCGDDGLKVCSKSICSDQGPVVNIKPKV